MEILSNSDRNVHKVTKFNDIRSYYINKDSNDCVHISCERSILLNYITPLFSQELLVMFYRKFVSILNIIWSCCLI